MHARDRALLLGQIDQHNSYLHEAARLRIRMKRRAPWRARVSMATTATLPMLFLSLPLLLLYPPAGVILACLTALLVWILALASVILGSPEQKLRNLERKHTAYMESVVGAGRYLHMQRHRETDTYSVSIRNKETNDLVLDLGTTENLPVSHHITG